MPGAQDSVTNQSAGDHWRPEVRALGRQSVILTSSIANNENFRSVDVGFNFLHLAGQDIVDAHDVNGNHAVGRWRG